VDQCISRACLNGPRRPDQWDAPTAEFLSQVRRFALMRSDGPSHAFYEQMKAQARSACPHLPGHEWDRLMDEVEKICVA